MNETKRASDAARNRVSIELFELQEKIQKLKEFLQSDRAKKLSQNMITLMRIQSSWMEGYATTLEDRLAIWDDQ